MFSLRRACAALLALTMGTSLAMAGDMSFFPSDINTAVPGHPGLVYFDLLKQLVPDLKPNETIAKGTTMAPVRHVMGPFMGAGGIAKLPDQITFGSFQTRIGTFEGQQRILILTGVGAGDVQDAPTLLMAFSADAEPKLIDALDVALDKTTSFGLPEPVAIGPEDQAVLTTSRHTDGDVTYLADALLFMHDGKFEPVILVPRLEKVGCGFQWTQPIRIEAQKPAKPGPYSDIKLTVTDTGALLENNCEQSRGEAPFSKEYSALFQWDAKTASFIADTSELDDLKDLTSTRF